MKGNYIMGVASLSSNGFVNSVPSFKSKKVKNSMVDNSSERAITPLQTGIGVGGLGFGLAFLTEMFVGKLSKDFKMPFKWTIGASVAAGVLSGLAAYFKECNLSNN